MNSLIIEDNKKGIKAAYPSGGHVLEVASIEDVNYQNITLRIREIEKESK